MAVVVVLDRPASYRISDETIAGSSLPRTLVDLGTSDVLDHQRTVRSMTRFAKDVLPQIKGLARTRPNNAKGAAE